VATDIAAMVELLLARGAYPDPEEGSRMTPLHTAAGRRPFPQSARWPSTRRCRNST
jgi:ankyrin repeat protein